MIYWVDGAGWNGRVSRFAVVTDEKEDIVVLHEKKTNNEMEYASLLAALEKAVDGDEIITDSQLVVGHVTKGWKVNKDHLRPLVDKAKEFVSQKNVMIRWVRRDENKAGQLLERT